MIRRHQKTLRTIREEKGTKDPAPGHSHIERLARRGGTSQGDRQQAKEASKADGKPEDSDVMEFKRRRFFGEEGLINYGKHPRLAKQEEG